MEVGNDKRLFIGFHTRKGNRMKNKKIEKIDLTDDVEDQLKKMGKTLNESNAVAMGLSLLTTKINEIVDSLNTLNDCGRIKK